MVAVRRMRFTAVLITVVFALTGFSSTGGSGSSGKSKSGGGGCSSSKSSKKKTHSGSGSRNGNGGSGSSASATPSTSPSGDPATAVVASCAGATPPVTTVKVTSRLDRKATFEVNLYRETASGTVLEATTARVTLEARATGTVDVALKEPARAAEVKTCRIGTVSVVSSSASATGSPAPTSSSGGSTSGSTSKPKPRATKRRS
ncbi:hypothetical protein [Streptomyces sp. H27-S2]|uniref:hypothetical protein n=1 Tax=Streptomyces antarcticus TaxID=2996458 RepID=UPI00226ED842|nr:hypothetical protein [Streptomyces sp. H27-S2]MCY0954997.1 hypothetical protein [Streptomyces sp. H27-S2]